MWFDRRRPLPLEAPEGGFHSQRYGRVPGPRRDRAAQDRLDDPSSLDTDSPHMSAVVTGTARRPSSTGRSPASRRPRTRSASAGPTRSSSSAAAARTSCPWRTQGENYFRKPTRGPPWRRGLLRPLHLRAQRDEPGEGAVHERPHHGPRTGRIRAGTGGHCAAGWKSSMSRPGTGRSSRNRRKRSRPPTGRRTGAPSSIIPAGGCTASIWVRAHPR